MTEGLTLLAAVIAAAASLYTAVTNRIDSGRQHRRETADALHLAMLELTAASARNWIYGPPEQNREVVEADARIMNLNGAIQDASVRELVERFRQSIINEALLSDNGPEFPRMHARELAQYAALQALEEYRRKLR